MKENESRDREMEICDDKASRNLDAGIWMLTETFFQNF